MSRETESSQSDGNPDIELSNEQKLQKVIKIVESLGGACARNTARVEQPNEVLPLPRPRFLRS